MSKKQVVSNVLATLTLIAFLPLSVNALVPQVMIYLGKNAQSFGLIFSLIILLVALIYAFFSNRVVYRKFIFLSAFVFFIYTFMLLFKYITEYDFSYIIAGYSPFFMLYVLIVVALIPGFIDQSLSKQVLYIACFICCMIGILQYTTGQPIVATSDSSGMFKISSYVYTSTYPFKIRGFSLFNSALDFGYFLIFCLGVFAYRFNFRNKSQSLICCLILLSGFTTLTRNIYLGIALALVSIIFYKYKQKLKNLLYILPFISLGVAFLVNSQPTEGSGLASTSSLQIRQQYWQQEITRQAELASSDFILGKGIYQSGDAETGKLFIDNTYLQFIAQYGFFGLIIFLSVYFSLLKFTIASENYALGGGFYSFLVVWPFIAFFNICIYPIGIFAIIVLLSKSSKSGGKYESRHYSSNITELARSS